MGEPGRAAFLKKQTPLGLLPMALFERAAASIEELKFARRAVVWQAGRPPVMLAWVRRGLLRRSTPDIGRDRHLTTDLLARGDMVGDVEILAGTTSGELVALEDALLFALPGAVATSLLGQAPGFALTLAQNVARRSQNVEERSARLLFHSAEVRLAQLLVDLVDRFGVRDSRGVILNARLAHRDLASLVGSTRETVSFALIALRERQILSAEDRRLVVVDEAALRRLARAAD